MITCTPIAIFRQRLLNAARAVEEFDHSEDRIDVGMVDMNHYVKECGSPACVLGHYAMRPDLQDGFRIKGKALIRDGESWAASYDGFYTLSHFGVTRNEAEELFGGHGCGATRMGSSAPLLPSEVASYIRAFVDRKYPQWL